MKKIPIIVIGGPTASGKTALSIEIAKKHNGEIISCDSMQIYKGMDIGTAKPDYEERENIPHHLIDITDPGEDFSVADFVLMAHDAAKDITKRGKLPVAIGGTGLYIDSFINDIDFVENDSSEEIRNELQKKADEEGIDVLVEMLREFDPVSAGKIHKNNERRIIRAIEFYKMTGKPISVQQEETKKKESRYDPCFLAIRWDMQKLYERIDKRVDIMIEKGLVNEVKSLIDKGFGKSMISMQGIGYKEIIDYLKGNVSFDEAIYNIKIGTRHYAKRQMTWFRRNEKINWIDYDCDIFEKAEEILKENGYGTGVK